MHMQLKNCEFEINFTWKNRDVLLTFILGKDHLFSNIFGMKIYTKGYRDYTRDTYIYTLIQVKLYLNNIIQITHKL